MNSGLDIREALKSGYPLLFDGAMGTAYAALPGCADKRCEQANITEPEKISAIHKAYLEAGCKAVKTNTFSVGPDIAYGDIDTARELIAAGCRIAKAAAAPYGAFVFADIGPAPTGMDMSPAENYIRQAEIFLEQGIGCFLAETMTSFEGIAEFARQLKERKRDAYLIVSFAVGPDGYTNQGNSGRELFDSAAAEPCIDAAGFNCGCGPYHMAKLISSLDLRGKTVSAMPNAGYPTVLGRRTAYKGTADYFAQTMEGIIDAGAAIVGGCCGTTPEHIARLRAVLDGKSASHQSEGPVSSQIQSRAGSPNRFWDKLESGRYVISVEYDPPASDDLSRYLDGVRQLKSAGVDAVTIPDCPVGTPRVDSSLLACRIRRELGVDPLPHMTCRDRNLNATKALLFGLSADGIHNVLIVTGDPMPSQSRDEVKSVFNCNSRKLAKYVTSISHDVMSPFRVFGALNVNARNFEKQLELARDKEQNGVCCFLTQPVLSDEALENLQTARRSLSAKILGGIYPVVSYKNACFMNNEISGIHVSDEICEMYLGLDRAEAEELALSLSVRIAADMRPFTDGIYIMTPFNRVSLVCRIIDGIKKSGLV